MLTSIVNWELGTILFFSIYTFGTVWVLLRVEPRFSRIKKRIKLSRKFQELSKICRELKEKNGNVWCKLLRHMPCFLNSLWKYSLKNHNKLKFLMCTNSLLCLSLRVLNRHLEGEIFDSKDSWFLSWWNSSLSNSFTNQERI